MLIQSRTDELHDILNIRQAPVREGSTIIIKCLSMRIILLGHGSRAHKHGSSSPRAILSSCTVPKMSPRGSVSLEVAQN